MTITKLPANHPAWDRLQTGFRMPFERKDLLVSLASGNDLNRHLGELGRELNNQGEVGEAEYAILPWLVEAIETQGEWNFMANTIIVDLDHCRRDNDPPSKLLVDMYHRAMEAFYGVCKIQFPPDGSARDYALMGAIIANQQDDVVSSRKLFDVAIMI